MGLLGLIAVAGMPVAERVADNIQTADAGSEPLNDRVPMPERELETVRCVSWRFMVPDHLACSRIACGRVRLRQDNHVSKFIKMLPLSNVLPLALQLSC